MNKDKWSDPTIRPSRLVIKLGEETGEVAKSFGDFLESVTRDGDVKALLAVVEECDHVIFIAEQLRDSSLAAANGMRTLHGA